jgi:hypothetical protein
MAPGAIALIAWLWTGRSPTRIGGAPGRKFLYPAASAGLTKKSPRRSGRGESGREICGANNCAASGNAQAFRAFPMPPILVSDPQYLAILNAAAALCPSERDEFYAAVARELVGKPIGDGSVGCAIRSVQAKFARLVAAPERGGKIRWERR